LLDDRVDDVFGLEEPRIPVRVVAESIDPPGEDPFARLASIASSVRWDDVQQFHPGVVAFCEGVRNVDPRPGMGTTRDRDENRRGIGEIAGIARHDDATRRGRPQALPVGPTRGEAESESGAIVLACHQRRHVVIGGGSGE
jgi:hypothetical protein